MRPVQTDPPVCQRKTSQSDWQNDRKIGGCLVDEKQRATEATNQITAGPEELVQYEPAAQNELETEEPAGQYAAAAHAIWAENKFKTRCPMRDKIK